MSLKMISSAIPVDTARSRIKKEIGTLWFPKHLDRFMSLIIGCNIPHMSAQSPYAPRDDVLFGIYRIAFEARVVTGDRALPMTFRVSPRIFSICRGCVVNASNFEPVNFDYGRFSCPDYGRKRVALEVNLQRRNYGTF